MTTAPTFLLVHSPLVGPTTWEGVASELRARGHHAVVPSLLGASTEEPPYWRRHVEAAVAGVAGATSVVAVGHSGAGPLLPAIGSALGGRASAYVFVDSNLPAPGRSRLDGLHPALRAHLHGMAHDGLLPAWSEWFERGPVDALPDEAVRAAFLDELAPVPLEVLAERLPDVPGWPDAPCGYLRLSPAYDPDEAAAARLGWTVGKLDGTHLEMLVRPQLVAVRLLAVVRRTGVDGV